jgi:hypothetical protein
VTQVTAPSRLLVSSESDDDEDCYGPSTSTGARHQKDAKKKSGSKSRKKRTMRVVSTDEEEDELPSVAKPAPPPPPATEKTDKKEKKRKNEHKHKHEHKSKRSKKTVPTEDRRSPTVFVNAFPANEASETVSEAPSTPEPLLSLSSLSSPQSNVFVMQSTEPRVEQPTPAVVNPVPPPAPHPSLTPAQIDQYFKNLQNMQLHFPPSPNPMSLQSPMIGYPLYGTLPYQLLSTQPTRSAEAVSNRATRRGMYLGTNSCLTDF